MANKPNEGSDDLVVDIDVELKGDHTIRPQRPNLPREWPRPQVPPPAPASDENGVALR